MLFLGILGVIAVLALIIFFIVCAVKESATTGKYLGVYSRTAAYFFVTFFYAGIVVAIGAIILIIASIFTPDLRQDTNVLGYFIAVILGIVLTGLGFLIYKSKYRKCPPYLQSKLFLSMTISGWGVGAKLGFFWIGGIWAIQAATAKASAAEAEERREREMRELEERKEEIRKDIWKQTGVNPQINSDGTYYKLGQGDDWHKINY